MKQRRFAALASAMGMLILILDSRTAFAGAAQGVELCIKTVIPSLFPFLFLSGVFSTSFQGDKLPVLRLLGKAFRLPPQMDYLLIPAFLGGYPIGAQAVSQAHRSGLLGKEQAERYLAFCSNVGPAFLFGILSLKFDRKRLLWAMWGVQILSAWTAARVFSPSGQPDSIVRETEKDAPPSLGIETAIRAMLKICGWVTLFRVVISFLDRWVFWAVSPAWRVTLMGLLELSNGCCCLNLISQESLRFLVCNFILAFGGICVAYQTASVCPGLKLRYYYAGKTLQGASAVILSVAVYNRLLFVIPLWIAITLLITTSLQKRSRNPTLLGV